MRVMLEADGLLKTELGEVANYVENHPEDRDMVGRNVRRMLDLYTQNQHYAAKAIMVQVEQARQRLLQPAGASVPATTSAEYKQRNEPMAALLQSLIKRIEKCETPADDSASVFDPSSGKTLVPFARAMKVTSGANLIYALSLLVIFYTSVMKKAPKVYFRFMEVIVQVTGSHGHSFAHKLADGMLRKLDAGLFDNPAALMKAGEHNMIIDTIQRQQASIAAALGTTGMPGAKRFTAFGDVTIGFGEPGAAIITDPATKTPRPCMHFHATPQRKCTAGVPLGHQSGKAGQCMFEH
jgi:hypothetical protein